ncbi:MAG: DUF6231 family protein [Gammaproteobacteria bacterium]
MNLVQETLLESLEAAAPKSLLCIAPDPLPAADIYRQHQPDCAMESVSAIAPIDALQDLGRFDFALVHRTLEGLDMDSGTALLARLRDIHCPRFDVTWSARSGAPAWTDGSFISLGLSLRRRIELDGVTTTIYHYDIDTYNPQREWNDSRDWANPGNFDRYRW